MTWALRRKGRSRSLRKTSFAKGLREVPKIGYWGLVWRDLSHPTWGSDNAVAHYFGTHGTLIAVLQATVPCIH